MAWFRFRSGRWVWPVTRIGCRILSQLIRSAAPRTPGTAAVYARVSSVGQRADLDRQVARVTAWAAGEGLAVSRVVTGVGSALNGRVRKFLALLRDDSVTTIVAEHRDRFARFGAGYVEAALSAQGRRNDRWPPSQKACGAVSLRRHCPDQVLGGRRSAHRCPASRPSRRDSGLPGGWCGPAPSITSQTILTLHGAEDGRLARAESPGMDGPDVQAPANSAQSGQRRKPAAAVPGVCRAGARSLRPVITPGHYGRRSRRGRGS